MTKFLGSPLTTIGAAAIVLVLVFAATQFYTAPATAAGSPSSSVPKKKCKKNYVWSQQQKKCVKKISELLTDDDLYLQARAYVEDGKYDMALDLLRRVKNQNQPRVLNYIGYSTRRLGDVDEGIRYYKKALSLNPNYNVAREYLGEGYLQKGDLASAKQQLSEIAKRCGVGCEEYKDLAEEIAKYEAKGKATSG
jgi:tetratricopeptide (TPR) repeat protein